MSWMAVRGEMEVVVVVGKVQRGVQGHVQTTTSANETRCARVTNNCFEEHRL